MFIPQKIKPIIPMRLQYFGGEEPPEGGGTEPPAGGESKQQTQEPNTPPGGGEEKTFKQEDVNNVVAKETKKAQEKLLKQLGIEDFENAKEGMQKFKEWQDSQKTESEKQQERLTNLETSYNTTSEENTSLKAQISAMKNGVNADSVEDVVTLAKGMVNDEVTMDDAITKVIEKYPHFKGDPQEEKKPAFTNGEHKKQSVTDLDHWKQAFK